MGEIPTEKLMTEIDCLRAMVESMRVLGWLLSNQNADSLLSQINHSIQQQTIVLDDIYREIRKTNRNIDGSTIEK
jgi:hypothetical protein